MVPEPIEDPTLGRIIWDREQDYWLGTVELTQGIPIWLAVLVGSSERQSVLALAREAVARTGELEPEARKFLAAEMSKARMSGVAQGSPGDLNPALASMILKSISTEPGGDLDLTYSDERRSAGVAFLVSFDGDGDCCVTVLDERLPDNEADD